MNKLEKTIVAATCIIPLSIAAHTFSYIGGVIASNYKSPTAQSYSELADRIRAARCSGALDSPSRPADCGTAYYPEYLNY
jgi:hypothetical protein